MVFSIKLLTQKQNGSEPEEPKPPWRAGATSASESEVRRLAMAGATEGGLSAVLLVLIVSFWLPDRYRQDGAEAPSLLIAITPWFARRSPFGVREHSTPADVCKQVEQVRDLSPVRLHLTLRPPISTSVHHLLSGNCDAQLLSQKNRISRPACTLLGASARAAPVSPSRSGTGRQPFPQVSPGLPPHDFSPAPCQGTQSLDLCSTLPVSGSFLCPIALLQALCDPPAGLPRRACSLGVGVRFPVAGRRRTASPEGSDRRQAPCVSAANVVSSEQPPPPCASCIARCSCPRTSPASPHSPPAFQRSSPSPSCFKQVPRPQDGRLLGS